MNFTQQEFSEKLKTKLTNNGKKPLQQSTRSFDALVEKIYKRLERSDDDSEIDAAVEEYAPDFETIEGNLRNDYASFVNRWNEEHPAHDGENPKPDNKPQPATGSEDRLADLFSRLEKMERRQAQRDLDEKIANIRTCLAAELKKKGVDNKEWVASYVAKIALNDKSDIETETNDALKLYNSLVAGNDGDDITPGKPGGKNGSDFDISDLKKN